MLKGARIIATLALIVATSLPCLAVRHFQLGAKQIEAKEKQRDSLMQKARVDLALPIALEIIKLRQAASESKENSTQLARANGLCAYCLQALGRQEESLQYFQAATRVIETAYPGGSADAATYNNNLAHALIDLGRPEQALPAARRALDALKGFADVNPIMRAACKTSLANCLSELGRSSEAAAEYQEALDLRKGSPFTTGAIGDLHGLAVCALAVGEEATCKIHLDEALDKIESYLKDFYAATPTKPTLEALEVMSALFENAKLRAGFYIHKKEFGAANVVLDGALSFARMAIPEGDATIQNLKLIKAYAACCAKDYSNCLAISTDILSHVSVPSSFLTPSFLEVIAKSKMGMKDGTVQTMREVLVACKKAIESKVLLLDDKSLRSTIDGSEGIVGAAFDVSHELYPEIEDIRFWETSAFAFHAQLLQKSSDLIEFRDKKRRAERNVATAIAATAAGQDQNVREALTTVEQADAVLKERAQKLLGTARPLTAPSLREIQEHLKPNQAIIDCYRIIDFSDYPNIDDNAHYKVAITLHEGEPIVVDLPMEKEIEAKVRLLYALLTPSTRGDGADDILKELYSQIFGPISSHLEGIDELIVVPDGALARIPFSALLGPDGKYLIQRYTITYLSSPAALLVPQSEAEATGTYVFSSPIYGSGGAKHDLPDLIGAARGNSEFDYWTPLAGGESEGNLIGEVVGAKVLSGANATKSAFLKMKSPKYLHVATHGFFYSRSAKSRSGDSTMMKELSSFDDPMLRSGLVLANANDWASASPDDNGWVTAYEVAQMDLSGTQLVVLSACDTANGDFSSGSGIVGLRRAFQLAGAHSVVMSLFDIPDRGTPQLMETFYQSLTKVHPAEALRAAQLQLVAEGKNAYYWGAFVHEGLP